MKSIGRLSNLHWLRFIALVIVLGVLLGVSFGAPGQTIWAAGNESALQNPDPTLKWSTFLGGSGDDVIESIALGKNGSIYVAGTSSASWGSPKRAYSKGNDVFVAKLNSSGKLIWNTFLGGNGDDHGHHLAVDPDDNVYAIGDSSANWGSPLHPFSVGGAEVPLAKVSPDGNLLWNTFFGNGGANGIVVDHGGNVLVVGGSGASWGNPKNPYSDACPIFVAKFGTAGQLIWNTFSGGFLDHMVQVDSSDNIYVANYGGYWSVCGTPIVGWHDDFDTIVSKLDSNGTALWNTFIGGGSGDYFGGFDVDANGNAFVTGMSGFPWGTPINPFSGVYSGFLVKLNPNGGLVWSTFFGGTYWTSGSGIALDGNRMFLAGWTGDPHGRPGFPNQNALALEFDLDGHEVWRALFGGAGMDSSRGIVTDHHGALYVAGQSDATWATPQNPYTNKTDGFVVKFVYPTTPDTVQPKINLTKTGTDAIGHKFIEMTAQDEGSGIAKIQVLRSDNANTVVPSFTSGSILPVKITSTKIDPAKKSVVSVRVTDMAGNVTIGDPVLQLLAVEQGKRIQQTFKNIPPQEHFVNVANGTPGLRRLRILVNGKLFGVVKLAKGTSQTIDVASAMGQDANRIMLVGQGKPGSSAFIIIGDSEMNASAMLEEFIQAQKDSPKENFGWGEWAGAE